MSFSFGTPTTTASGSAFGSTSTPGGFTFGSGDAKPLFGGAASPGNKPFSFTSPTTSAPAFGGFAFGANTAAPTASAFSTPATTTAAPAFGASKPLSFGGFSSPPNQTVGSPGFGQPVQNAANLSFGGQPQQPAPAFGTPPTPASTGFSFGGSEKKGGLFGSPQQPAAPTSTAPQPTQAGFSFGSASSNVNTGTAATTSFGSPQLGQQSSGFGQPSAFGAPATQPATFGTNPASTSALSFGQTALAQPTQTSALNFQTTQSQPTGLNFSTPTTTQSGLSFTPATSGISFGTPTSALNFGASPTTKATSLNFATTTAAAPSLNFGTTAATAQSFGKPTATAQSFGTTTATSQNLGTTTATALNFGTAATTSASSTPTTKSGLNISTPSYVPTTGLNFNVVTSSQPTGLNFGATTTATGISFGTTTAATTAAGISFAPASTAPSSTSLSFFKPPSTVSTATAASTTPSGITPLSKSTAATTMPSLSTAVTTVAAPTQPTPIASLTFAQLEENINKWTLDLEEQEKLFLNQATQINAWDRLLISNGEKILELNDAVTNVKNEQQSLEHELDFVQSQQKELEDLLTPMEKQLLEENTDQLRDPEREQMYSLAENLDTQLKQMSEDLKEVIEHLNETNRSQDSNDPIVQIGRILNAHMSSMQWIDNSITQISSKLDNLKATHDTLRRDNERSFQLTYN